MFRRIANSLSAKVFLLTAGLLAAGCLALYLAVAFALPGGYRSLSAARAEQAASALASELSGADAQEASEIVKRFAAENGASVSLSEGRSETGATDVPDGSAYTVSVAVELADGSSELLTISDTSGALGIIADALVRLFPPAALLIVIVSAAGAWACTRLVARPVVEIADVSERLSRLDMTWVCDERRDDEVGMLARSLNAMAARLKRTIAELKTANVLLRAEADAACSRDRERRDFLAAASHELKTPLAAARAQVEGMMLGFGDFAHHDAHLPRALAAIDRMDALVREMLDAARADEMPPAGRERIDVRELASAALMASRDLAASRALEVVLTDGAPLFVDANRSQLEIVISNAVSNAARYATPGSRVAIGFSDGRFHVENPCDQLPQEILARLTEPFFRADVARSREDGGSGLGLYLVKRTLERLGVPLSLACDDGVFVFEADLSGIIASAQTES